jgi:hypothetical protein
VNPKGKRTAATLLLLLAAISACRKPPEPPAETKPARTQPASQDSGSDLAFSVAAILHAAHRSGSLVYHAQCDSPGKLSELYPLTPPVNPEPMDQALAEITRRYPNLKWKSPAAGRVTIADRSARAGLLQVRIPEFIIIDDRDPDDVITTIWKTPEVKAFLKKNRLRLLPPPRRATRRARGPAVVHLRNATVTEILDAILASYKDGASRLWVYRECHGKGPALAEVRVM